MFRIILSIIFLCLCLSTQSFAVNPPKPIKGTPGIISKSFVVSAGNFTFEFKLDSVWGIGNMNKSANGSGHFELFPVKGGVGCTIDITNYESKTAAEQAFSNLKKKYPSSTKTTNGFEVSLSKAFFSCRITNEIVVETWYSFPKKNNESTKSWNFLKNCLIITPKEPTQQEPPQQQKAEKQILPLVQKTFEGWAFNHPSQKITILFNMFSSRENEDSSKNYCLKFNNITCSGFFYLKWNPDDLDPKKLFETSLEEMRNDFSLAENPDQKWYDLVFNLEKGYAYQFGKPYSLYTSLNKQNEFLCGFAVKQTFPNQDYDINDLFNNVKYVVRD